MSFPKAWPLAARKKNNVFWGDDTLRARLALFAPPHPSVLAGLMNLQY